MVDVAGLTGNIVILPVTVVLLSYTKEKERSGSSKPCQGGRQDASVLALATTSLRHAFTQRVVLTPLFAIAFVLTDIHLPGDMIKSLKLLGSTVGGISLFASGIILQSQTPRFSLSASVSTHVRTRAVSPPPDGGRLLDAAKSQQEFDFCDASGTLVGIYSPGFSGAFSITGYHFHFLSDDRTQGGHVLDVAAASLRLQVKELSAFHLALPETETFLRADLSRDASADLKQAEGG